MVRTARDEIGRAEAPPSAAAPLAGRRVLLVEDEALVAIDLEMTLEGAGAVVVGPFLRLSQAMDAVARAGPLDVAVLDVVLGRDESYPLAELLAERGVPFVLHSGHVGSIRAAERYAAAHLCPKPCSPATILRTIVQALAR